MKDVYSSDNDVFGLDNGIYVYITKKPNKPVIINKDIYDYAYFDDLIGSKGFITDRTNRYDNPYDRRIGDVFLGEVYDIEIANSNYHGDDIGGSNETDNLTLSEELENAGVIVTSIDGVQYYDYSEPINTVFWDAAEEASTHEWDLKWFISKVNHTKDWDIKIDKSWEKTVGTPFPGSYNTQIVVNGRITTPEELGNMMYGYTGTAAKIPKLILIFGSIYAAGFWNIITDIEELINELNDHVAIKKGIKWYKEDRERKK